MARPDTSHHLDWSAGAQAPPKASALDGPRQSPRTPRTPPTAPTPRTSGPHGAASADDLAHVESLLAQFEQLEQQLHEVRDGLMHSHRLATLGTIATVIAHEFNNILTPIITYADLALSKDDPDLTRKALEKASSGAMRAGRICGSPRGFAREADEAHSAQLRPVIDDTFACLARDPQRDGIKVTIDVPEARVAMSALNLQQVMLNLVLNARQAIGDDGGSITITGRVEGTLLKVDVADTGPGIAPDLIDRVFEPFVSRRRPTGSDREADPPGCKRLGLSICRDLVRAVGGAISVESEPGSGATFHLTLPLAEQLFEST